VSCVPLEEFLALNESPILDVRSPCEFMKGHIPGSISFPLFSDEERGRVGTLYKQQGHDVAVLAGLGIVGPKLKYMAENLLQTIAAYKATSSRLLCYRGGMRSASVQWLSGFIGIPCTRLECGYKGYRTHVLQSFERSYRFVCIGGKTGSGKTELLGDLAKIGAQTIDLEALANHYGSAFGLLPNNTQPTIEQFENTLSEKLCSYDPHQPIFIEDESRSLGSCVIPKNIYTQMSDSDVMWVETPYEERLSRIVDQYGKAPLPWLLECTKRLEKRLSREKVDCISRFIQEGALREAARELLVYYDRTYEYGLSTKTRKVHSVDKKLFLPYARECFMQKQAQDLV
jgi:tRNA 2-selenouridine synthase